MGETPRVTKGIENGSGVKSGPVEPARIVKMAQTTEPVSLTASATTEPEPMDNLKSENMNVRLEALKHITDESVILSVVRNDVSQDVVKAAITRITDQDELRKIAVDIGQRGDTRRLAVACITSQAMLFDIARNTAETRDWDGIGVAAAYRLDDEDLLYELAKSTNDSGFKNFAVKRIKDEAKLIDIAKTEYSSHVRSQAVRQIKNQAVLNEIAREDSDPTIIAAAVCGIEDQNILANHAIEDRYKLVGVVAVNMITDQEELKRVVTQAPNPKVRINAVRRLESSEALISVAKNDPDKFIRAIAAGRVSSFGNIPFVIDILENEKDRDIRKCTMAEVTDQAVLLDVITNKYGDTVDTRESVIHRISDPEKLIEIVKSREFSLFSRKDALSRIPEEYLEKVQDTLIEIVKTEVDTSLRHTALDHITNNKVLADIAKGDQDPYMRFFAARRINDQETLIELARNEAVMDIPMTIRHACVQLIDDQNILTEIVRTDDTDHIKLLAMTRIKDRSKLADIVETEQSSDLRCMVVRSLTDRKLLMRILTNDMGSRVRHAAVDRLYKLSHEKASK